MDRRQQFKEEGLVKMLRYVLGVQPAEFGLVPDPMGWVKLKDLLAALHDEEGWRGVRESMIRDAAERLAPGVLEADDKRIRAVNRTYTPQDYTAEPPGHLYVGLRRRAWPVVKDRGLSIPEDGQPFILAADQEKAKKLGLRRDGEPVPVTVQAQMAQASGAVITGWGPPELGLYLADWIPADCLMGPPVPDNPLEKKPPRQKRKPAQEPVFVPDHLAGSFSVLPEMVEKPYKQKGLKKEIAWKQERKKDQHKKKGE